jgi:hypothetical protein
LTGYATNQKRIDSLIVKEVIDDLNKVPLNNIEYPPNESKDTTKGMNQKPKDKSDKISDVSPKSGEKKDEHSADVVDKIRKKLIQKKELEPVEKKERRFTAAWIAAIAAVAIIINILIFYLFIGSFKDLKNEFSVKLDSMKDNIQNQLSTIKDEIDKPPPKIYQQSDRNLENDIDNQQERIGSKSDLNPAIDNSTPASGFDAENVAEKNSIVVKRGETLAEIITRFYGKEDPKILDAVLKINPEIKNPDLIYENQIIKLPAQP